MVSREAAARTGLLEGTIVVGGAGDNPAAGVGMGAMTDGRAFTTIGTSGVPYLLTEKVLPDYDGRVNCLCAAAPGKWMMMGCIQAAGYSLKWLRDVVCGIEIEEARALDAMPLKLWTIWRPASDRGARDSYSFRTFWVNVRRTRTRIAAAYFWAFLDSQPSAYDSRRDGGRQLLHA